MKQGSPGTWSVSGFACAVVVCLLAGAAAAAPEDFGVALMEADFKQLDTDQAAAIAKCDQVFNKRDYKAAIAEYNVFLEEFGSTAAAGYALTRKGISQMQDNKRMEAIITFKEVIDYFPDAVEYAAAALYYQGVCCLASGERLNAVKAWQKMLADKDYSKHRLAAPALAAIADELLHQEKPEEALAYYERAALEFRRQVPLAANRAIERACFIHIRVRTDEKKFRDFYNRAETTRKNPEPVTEDGYWTNLRAMIAGYGSFSEEEEKKRKEYYSYWADLMEGKRMKDNEFQIDWIAFKRIVDGDEKKWVERLDKQFNSTFKPGMNEQVLQFMQVFGRTKGKAVEYYQKFTFPDMSNELIVQVICLLLGIKEMDMARSTVSKIDQTKWTDKERLGFVTVLATFGDEGIVIAACNKIRDMGVGKNRLLKYYAGDEYGFRPDKVEKGVAVATEVVKDPRFASEAYFTMGGLYTMGGKLTEAIDAYRDSNLPPRSSYAIANCYVQMRKKEDALGELIGIENFFAEEKSRAALAQANVYAAFSDEAGEIGTLRRILKQYTDSQESNEAHIRLERKGVAMGGGKDAE